jgi:hypothetical protein
VADYNPRNVGNTFTKAASAAVTGGQVLEATGNDTVGPAGAGSAKVVGVAAFDQPTTGGRVTIWRRTLEHVTVIKSGTVLAAGDPIKTAAAGTIDKYVTGTDAVGLYIGIAVTGGTGDGTVTASWVGI